MRTHNEIFEEQCKMFEEDTGYLSPLKDRAVANTYTDEQEKFINALWKVWHKAYERGLVSNIVL